MRKGFSTSGLMQQAGDDLIARLHEIKADKGGGAAVATAIGALEGSVKFIRANNGSREALGVCNWLLEMIRDGREGIFDAAVEKLSAARERGEI